MAKFCAKCGVLLDPKTGICPECAAVYPVDPQPRSKRKISKTTWIALMIAAGVVVILAVVLMMLVFMNQSATRAAEDAVSAIGEPYHPTQQERVVDTETGIAYFQQLLIVYTQGEVDAETAVELAEVVGGTVVGRVNGGVHALQIRVEATALAQLNELAAKLMEEESVLYAGYEYPVEMDLQVKDSNPWSADAKKPILWRGMENLPGGNDWWAEFIGSYTAGALTEASEPIRVGVIDNGFDLDHEDLTGRIGLLEGYTANTEADHGTHVAGIIAAINNKVGIRGVSDAELVCVDWMPQSNDKKDPNFKEILSSGEYANIINQMVTGGVRIVNNSWSYSLMTEKGYAAELNRIKIDQVTQAQIDEVCNSGAYEKYLKQNKETCDRTAQDCILMLAQMLMDGKEDFLVVQSAGNGYSDNGVGYDTTTGGYFTGIRTETYNMLPEKTLRYFKENRVTFEDIKDHTIIVGATTKEKQKGNYLMTDFSNYGKGVDLCAPGKDIFSTVTENRYQLMSGTSMAAPIVSGAAAKVWACAPSLSAKEVKNYLIDTAKKTAISNQEGDPSKTYPIVHVGAAVKQVLKDQEKLSPEQEKISFDFDFEALYTKYLKETLVPQKGVCRDYDRKIETSQESGLLYLMDEHEDLEQVYLFGISSVYIKDLNGDEIPEMVVVAVNDEGTVTADYYYITAENKVSKPQTLLQTTKFDNGDERVFIYQATVNGREYLFVAENNFNGSSGASVFGEKFFAYTMNEKNEMVAEHSVVYHYAHGNVTYTHNEKTYQVAKDGIDVSDAKNSRKKIQDVFRGLNLDEFNDDAYTHWNQFPSKLLHNKVFSCGTEYADDSARNFRVFITDYTDSEKRDGFTFQKVTDKEKEAFFEKATDFYFDWFFDRAYIDWNVTKELDGKIYNKVSHKTINTYAKLSKEAKKYFTDDVVKEWLKTTGARDVDGELYMLMVGGYGSLTSEVNVQFYKVNENQYRVCVTTYCETGQERFFGGGGVSVLLLQDGKWRFDGTAAMSATI